MIRPKRLRQGDTVALVSLSSGIAGEELFRHRYEIGKKRIESEFGLRAVAMPNALKGVKHLDMHPEARASDLMEAFADPQIKAIICMIGGDDTIRLLPYVDFDLLRRNPKIFLGYSDTTVNHFMMRKAGLVSFYGPSVFAEFAENVAMHEYTKRYLRQVLFDGIAPLPVLPSPEWTSEHLEWADEKNDTVARKMLQDDKGYELLQGSGTVTGRLIGGCIDVFPMMIGSAIWPDAGEWDGAILFLETSEEHPSPSTVKYLLRGLAAQGILNRINGVIVGKPKDEIYYEECKEVYRKVIGQECGRPELPVLYNLNFGHASPICTLPCGMEAEINCDNRSFTLLEPAVE